MFIVIFILDTIHIGSSFLLPSLDMISRSIPIHCCFNSKREIRALVLSQTKPSTTSRLFREWIADDATSGSARTTSRHFLSSPWLWHSNVFIVGIDASSLFQLQYRGPSERSVDTLAGKRRQIARLTPVSRAGKLEMFHATCACSTNFEVSDTDTATLGAYTNAAGDRLECSLFLGYEKQINQHWTTDASVIVGNYPRYQARVIRHLSPLTSVGVGYENKNSFSYFNLDAARKLSEHTSASVICRLGLLPGAGFRVAYDPAQLFASRFRGPPPVLNKRTSQQHTVSASAGIELGLGLAPEAKVQLATPASPGGLMMLHSDAAINLNEGPRIELGGTQSFGQFCRFGTGVSVSRRGISLIINCEFGNCKLAFPILLTDFSMATTIYHLLAPFGFAFFGGLLLKFLGPIVPERQISQAEHEKFEKEWSNCHYTQYLMNEKAADTLEEERKQNGLVIIEARYGCDDPTQSENDNPGGPGQGYYINVTDAIRFFVKNSKLTLTERSKAGMLGFCNPIPPHLRDRFTSRLYIHYMFNQQEHRVVFDDEQRVSLP